MIARRVLTALWIVLVAAVHTACEPADPGDVGAGEAVSEATAETVHDGNVVEMTAVDYAFVGPAEIPSGWTTFRLKNEGMEHHFLLLNRLPDDKTFEEYVAEVAVPFDSVWHELRSGAIDKPEAGAMLGRLLPAWYGSVAQMGGPGLVAAGGVAETTVMLEPGNYVMECYVKTPDGEFHASLGMARPLTVTSESSEALPPEASLDITLSNYELAIEGDVTAGQHTVAVHFREHPELGLGNDVHVVWLEGETDLSEVVSWMDWMNVSGLREPAPADFVGGAHEMPVGYTAYFTVDLAPGRYAWIAESAADKGMVKEFRIE
jgi:hypothetical protein